VINSRHKAECEALLAASGLTYTVLRMSAIPRYDEGFDELRFRAMFAIPPADRKGSVQASGVTLNEYPTASGVLHEGAVIGLGAHTAIAAPPSRTPVGTVSNQADQTMARPRARHPKWLVDGSA
jgi:hypothetical protein